MKRLNGKRTILWILAVILCMTACGPAFASAGDRTVYYADSENMSNVQGVVQTGDSTCVIISETMNTVVKRYTDLAGEPETFVLSYEELFRNSAEEAEKAEQAAPEADQAGADQDEEEEEDADEGFLFFDTGKNDGDEEDKREEEEESNSYSYGLNAWFGWNGELYGLQPETVATMESTRITKIAVKHVKLEDGKVILEDCDIPALSPDGLVDGGDQYQYFAGTQRMFVLGDQLVLLPYSYGSGIESVARKMILFNLKDGETTNIDVDESADVIPGPDGSLLVIHKDWAESTMSFTISQMDVETQDMKEFIKLEGIKDYEVAMCYDQEKGILYYTDQGELWAKTIAEPEKPAESVNDCSEGQDMILLEDGFVLIWSYRAVVVKNTDPSQRQGITLRVFSTGYSNGINDAIFAMNAERGDISVILQQEWRSNEDLLQAMLNRDAQNDVYVLSYSSSEFKALRDRGYLMDMSGEAEIAEATERMYPYLRDAMKKNGKIIGVPVSLSGEGFGLNKHVFNELKLTEEELPKTWDQLLDWLPVMYARLEGTDFTLVDSYMDSWSFRFQMIRMILNQYQVWMDSKGESYDFNTPLLKNLLQRVNDLDCEALGIKEEVDYEAMNADSYVYHEALLSNSSLYGISSYSYTMILPLGFDEESRLLPISVDVAFVNPYSEHPEEAKDYLKTVLKKMENNMQYVFFTDKTEPVPSPYAEESQKYYDEYIAEMKKKLEKAEGEEKAELEEELRTTEKQYEENKEDMLWSISSRMIESYQKDMPLFTVEEYSLFNELYNSEDDKESRKLMSGLFNYGGDEEEKISIEEALSLLDTKIQMKRREGN